jgi:hypothetical protein
LDFSYIKNIHTAKLISDLKKFLKKTKKISVTYIVKKGKQICVLIFSKEILVAVFIFVQSIRVNIESDLYHLSFLSFEVY